MKWTGRAITKARGMPTRQPLQTAYSIHFEGDEKLKSLLSDAHVFFACHGSSRLLFRSQTTLPGANALARRKSEV